MIVVACCGLTIERTLQDLPILERMPYWNELPAVRNGAVFISDGNAYFSRPGPRLADALEWLEERFDLERESAAVGIDIARSVHTA